MSQRIDITKYVIKELGLSTDDKTYKKYNAIWWVNPRKKEKGGLRLTELGLNAFKSAKIKSYNIDFEEPIETVTNKFLIHLDNYIDSPFYLTLDHIEVFTERMAIQLVLFGGDIQKFLGSKNRSKLAEKQQ
jgi:hypothetical protein